MIFKHEQSDLDQFFNDPTHSSPFPLCPTDANKTYIHRLGISPFSLWPSLQSWFFFSCPSSPFLSLSFPPLKSLHLSTHPPFSVCRHSLHKLSNQIFPSPSHSPTSSPLPPSPACLPLMCPPPQHLSNLFIVCRLVEGDLTTFPPHLSIVCFSPLLSNPSPTHPFSPGADPGFWSGGPAKF